MYIPNGKFKRTREACSHQELSLHYLKSIGDEIVSSCIVKHCHKTSFYKLFQKLYVPDRLPIPTCSSKSKL